MTYPPASIPDRANGTRIDASHANALRDAIANIVAELGTNPSGDYATVQARLDAIVATPPPPPPVTPAVGINGLTGEHLEHMKTAILADEEPQLSAWNAMLNSTSGAWETSVRPTAQRYSMTSATNPSGYVSGAVAAITEPDLTGARAFFQDAWAARTQALMWYVTGTTYHRDQVITILNDWSSTLVSIQGKGSASDASVPENCRLFVSWGVASFCAAADIIRSTADASWDDTDQTAFADMMTDIVLPRLDWNSAGNWKASFAEGRLAIAAYLRDETMMDRAVRYWQENIRAGISHPGDTTPQAFPRPAANPTWPYDDSEIASPTQTAGPRITPGTTFAGVDQSNIDLLWRSWQFHEVQRANGFNGSDPDDFPGVNVVRAQASLSQETGRNHSYAVCNLSAWLAGAVTAWHYGRTELLDEHAPRLAAAFETAAAWWREAIKDRVDNARSINWYDEYDSGSFNVNNPTTWKAAPGWPANTGTTGNARFAPVGRYSLINGAADGVALGVGQPWVTGANGWMWGGRWGDVGWEMAYSMLSRILDYPMANTLAILQGWTEDNPADVPVTYGNLRAGGVSASGITGFQNNRGFDAVTDAWPGAGADIPDSPSPSTFIPNAVISAVLVGATVTVNGSASSLQGGSITGYSWNWGDGTALSTGASPTHTYAAAGTYQITLTVTGSNGNVDSETYTLPTIIAADDFNRNVTVASGAGRSWGTAQIGGAWTVSAESPSTWSSGVRTADGAVVLGATSGAQMVKRLDGVSINGNFDMLLSIDLVNPVTRGELRIAMRGRGESGYGAQVILRPAQTALDGSTAITEQLSFSALKGGSTVASITITNVDLADFAAGPVWFRVRFQNGSIYANVWPVGDAEPTTWRLTYTEPGSPITTAGPPIIMVRTHVNGAAPAQASYQPLSAEVNLRQWHVHGA